MPEFVSGSGSPEGSPVCATVSVGDFAAFGVETGKAPTMPHITIFASLDADALSRVGALAGAYDGADMNWAQREYGCSGHTDGQVRRRIVDMGRAWLENMGEELPVIFPAKAAKKAAYRLLLNPEVSMNHILGPHFEATADRCRGEPTVLAIAGTAHGCRERQDISLTRRGLPG